MCIRDRYHASFEKLQPVSLKSLPKGTKANESNMKDDITGEGLIQRSDDKPEALHKRLQAYHAQTQPILDYYEPQGVVRLINGDQMPGAVWEELEKNLPAPRI
eukprot:TRINITY_DN11992_c0_g1_i5.p2 TRINITY_DN11992_c0_g1~~TRINITY_DN11992_c0_g1_i5.p2  ORF type:complete len:103 (-),score=42.78 TRINITY_DN11992_c0_g1_i5:226-534(-)